MFNLSQELGGARTVIIAGHVRPDGDAVGSCLGLYHYLKENYPHLEVGVYLEEIPESLCLIQGTEIVEHTIRKNTEADIFFCLDCGDEERLGDAASYIQPAKKVICIDHHISNRGFADVNYIVPEASSTSELVYRLVEKEKISKACAAALYMGIVHDTGVFRHSCTAPETMEAAAVLMRKGIDCSAIINKTYYDKTYHQHQILGRALMESIMIMNKKVIFSSLKKKDLEFFGVSSSDLNGIVQTLMGTAGVEVAIFLYELENGVFKVSLRSREIVDVSKIASYFGGGGHVRAAGCTMQGRSHDVVNNITRHIEQQMLDQEIKID